MPREKRKLRDSVSATLYDKSGKVKQQTSSEKEDKLLKLLKKLLEWFE